MALTAHEASHLLFQEPPVALHEPVARPTFETWLHPSLQAIEACIDRLLAQCQVAHTAVDCIFLTGGSSFVPAIRHLFARKFDATRLRSGGELTSVVRGLALRACSLDN